MRWWGLQMRVGGTGRQEVRMVTTILCHRKAMSEVTRGVTIVNKRWWENMLQKRNRGGGWQWLTRIFKDGWGGEEVATRDGGKRRQRRWSGDNGCGGWRWQQRTMMATNNNGGGWQWQQRMRACKIRQQTKPEKDKSGWWEMAETAKWWWWLQAKTDNDGGRWWSKQDHAADYNKEGWEWVARDGGESTVTMTLTSSYLNRLPWF